MIASCSGSEDLKFRQTDVISSELNNEGKKIQKFKLNFRFYGVETVMCQQEVTLAKFQTA